MNGETFLLYTTETGGKFHVERCSEERYRWLVEDRKDTRFTGPQKLIALLRVEDHFDCVLRCSRDDKEGILKFRRDHDEKYAERELDERLSRAVLGAAA